MTLPSDEPNLSLDEIREIMNEKSIQDMDRVHEAKAGAMQSANGMLIALEAARYTVLEWEKRYPAKISEDQFQAMTSTIFIRLDKQGLISKLPASPLSRAPKKTPVAASQEQGEPF